MSQFFLPGDIVDVAATSSDVRHTIGYGVEKHEKNCLATAPGLLRTQNNKTWISVHSKRYIPSKGDRVLGVVTSKQGDLFKLDIGAADLAYINFLSFEGATKRNRPSIKAGDLLYAQVIEASKNLESELTCVDSVSRSKGLGVLNDGVVFKVSLHLARRLLSPSCQILKLLGKELKFEITVGLNGRVWLNGTNTREVIAIRNIILWSEYIVDSNTSEFVEKEIKKAQGGSQVPMES